MKIDHQDNQFHLIEKLLLTKVFPIRKIRDIHSKYIKYGSPFSHFGYAHELLHH